MSLGEEGDERAAVAVVQDHIGLDEVLARIGAARAGSMAFDAPGDPYRSAAIGGIGVDHMAVEGRSIQRGATAASAASTTSDTSAWRSRGVRRGEVVEQNRPFLGETLAPRSTILLIVSSHSARERE